MLESPDCVMVKGLRRGDMSSFRKLFDEKYMVFYTFIKGMTKDAWLAEDITQNIFMKVWVNKEKLKPDQSIHNYLYVLAKNEVRDHFKLKSNLVHQQLEEHDKMLFEDFEGTIDAERMQEKIVEVVSKMPEQRQMVYRLSREKMLSNKKIADELNISVRTVERHILLALKDIRKYLPLFFLFLHLILFKK